MIYKLTRDDETPQSFYSRCNGKGTTIIFIRNIQMVINLMDLQLTIWFGNDTYQRTPKA